MVGDVVVVAGADVIVADVVFVSDETGFNIAKSDAVFVTRENSRFLSLDLVLHVLCVCCVFCSLRCR